MDYNICVVNEALVHGPSERIFVYRSNLQSVTVSPDDIDHLGHVNNAVYLRWIQDAVVAHWERFAPWEAIRDHLWVAIRHEIDFRRPTFLGDAVLADTVIERIHGARALFTTRIRRGEELLAEARSSWCCIDAGTHRPTRLARDIVRRFLSSETD